MLATLLIVVAALAVFPAGAGQAVDGPALTAETPLYAHGTGSGATKWMSTIKVDAAGTDQTATLAFPGPAAYTPASFKLMPALAAPLTLDTAGKIKFNLRVGSGLLGNVGQFTTKLMAGTTEIASAAGPANDVIASAYKELALTATPKVATISPEMGELVWTVSFAGAGTAYIQISQSSQWCNLVLPIIASAEPVAPAGPIASVENVTGPSFEANYTSDVGTDASYQYNWSTEMTQAVLTYDASVENGTAAVTVMDGNGSTVFNQTITTGNATVPLNATTPGNWTVNVHLQAFVGNLTLAIGPVPVVAVVNGTVAGPAAVGGNSTEDKGIPSLELLPVMGAMLVGTLVLAGRRRRDE